MERTYLPRYCLVVFISTIYGLPDELQALTHLPVFLFVCKYFLDPFAPLLRTIY